MAINNTQFYRTGTGDATVLNTSGIDNAFAQALAKQQQQRQLELKQLTDQQAQLRPEGLRNDADRKDFFNKVNDWRSQAIAATQEKDPYKRSLLKSQADQAYLQAQDLANRSKLQAQKDNQFQQFAMNDATRHQLTDDAIQRGLANTRLGVNDPNLVDYSSLQRQVDHKKIMDELDKSDNALLKQTQFGTPTLTRAKVGNRMATFINNSRTVDPNDRAQMYQQLYDTRPDVKKFFNDIYPEVYNNPQLTPQQQRDAAIGQYIKQSGDVSEFHAPQEKVDQAPDKFYEHYNYELAHPRPTKEKTTDPTYFQDLSERMRTGVPGSGEEFNNQVANNPSYLHGLSIDTKNPKAVVLTIPTKYHQVKNPNAGQGQPEYVRAVETPSYKVTLDSTDPTQWHAGFAKVYRDITGDASASPSKAMTQGGKGKVPGGLTNPDQNHLKNNINQTQATTTINTSPVKIPPIPKNTPYKGIVNVKNAKGEVVQIGVKDGKWYYVKTNKEVDEPL